MTRSIGILLLAAFLALSGVLLLTNIQVVLANVILGLLAISAAVCLALGK